MTKKDYFYICLITTLIIGFVINDLMDVKDKQKPKLLYQYYPMVVEVEKPYSEEYKEFLKNKPKREKTTPPLLTKNYESEKNNPIKVTSDSSKLILIDTISKERYEVSKEFVSLFPNNDKLLNFVLSRDTLNIVTLNTKGGISGKTYPIYLDKFSYRYFDNELHHYPTKTKGFSKDKINQLYFNTEYDFNQKTTNIGLDYSMFLGRFRIMAGSDLELNTGTVRVKTKLGYRIF